ncbi:hypothetical protein C8F04DRAFT_1258357 [Mycena alexandri]|uniref:Uncharacterized protein n=1 Tax=Mycena alexandri TaxID=1745969 RepID=A0AAD6X8G8_9AGAR|nr:hypothetical protein C8F04DRAFT_1258357 [Mycena alexandri]
MKSQLERKGDHAARGSLQLADGDTDAVRLPPSGESGIWRKLSIVSAHQAENLLRWVWHTEATSFAYMTHVNLLKHNPVIQRSAGEIYLLLKEAAVRSTYWMLTTGNNKAPKAIPLEQQTSTNFDNSMQIYLGMAPMGDDKTTVLIAERPGASSVQLGTHIKLNIAISLYEQMLAHHWPLGLRTTPTQFTDVMIIDHAGPYPPDVAAWYTINALCPRRTHKGSSIQRHKFFELLMRILSVHGTLFRIATFGGYPEADLPLEHYPFRTDNITPSLVVAWLIQHGIKKEGEAVRVMEEFARARRNMHEGRLDPTGTVFKSGDWPRNSTEVLMLREDEVTPWASLRHATLQEFVTTNYPECPADAMEDDTQADPPSDDLTLNLETIFVADPFGTESFNVSAPLITAASALFGNNSFLNIAGPQNNLTAAQVLNLMCKHGNIPFSLPLDIARSPDFKHYCFESEIVFNSQQTEDTDAAVAQVIGLWFFNRFNYTSNAEYVLDMSMYFANRAMLNKAVLLGQPFNNHPLYTSGGLELVKPVKTLAATIIVSVLIAMQLVGLAILVRYIYSVPTWMTLLDALAVARIEREIPVGELPRLGMVTEEDVKKMGEVDGLIGVKDAAAVSTEDLEESGHTRDGSGTGDALMGGNKEVVLNIELTLGGRRLVSQGLLGA